MRNGVLAAALLIAAATPAAAQSTGDAAAGRWLAEEFGCNSCHGLMTASGLPAPHIAGQKKDYLARQMEAFRRPMAQTPSPYKIVERSHPLMSSWARPLDDAKTRNLAEYFATLPCVPKRAFGETQVPRPALIERCQFCHGETGASPYAGYPNIGGQKKAYLVQQLRAFRRAAGHASSVIRKEKDERFHRLMAPGVYDLKDNDIEAVAEYYSRQSCQ